MPVDPSGHPIEPTKSKRFAWGRPSLMHVGYGLLVVLSAFHVFLYAYYIRTNYIAPDWMFDIYRRPLGRDFINWWTAARVVLDGNIVILFDAELFHAAQESLFNHPTEFRNWSYPPHVLPWLLWLGFMPYVVSFALWTVLTFGAYAVAVAYKRPRPWTIVLFLVLAPATVVNVVEGQTGFLAAALLVGGLRLVDRYPVAAGILFGFLTFKAQYGIMVPIALIAGGHWRTMGAATLTTLVLVVISFLMYGRGPWHDYIVLAVPYQRLILEHDIINQPYQLRMISSFFAVRFLGSDLSAAYDATMFAGLISVLGIASVFVRTRSPDLRTVSVIAGTFLTSPYLLNYDTPAVGAAVIALIAAAHMGEKRLSLGYYICFAFMWLLPLVVMNLNKGWLPIYPLVPLALLGIAVVWAGQRPFKQRALDWL